MKNIVFCILSVIFYIFYYNVLLWIFNRWVPLNATTDVLSLFIFIFVNIPLSVISAQMTIKIIKKFNY
ncbi:hypothetical protein [Clostridium lacusfryxellense]|uniref:hypothetical protein n=1 Tax=Clostridium lacusfryxellense TaxID=205328 RepID=UPI001C0B71EB|nr:hypothetical protein [Clostridium lacusfryxellense]MBU3113679.1 hypothetical protein [Clostridium lacusfryxellense]